MFGVDHELMPNFGLSATYTYRYYNHFDWRSGSLIGVNASNYTQTGTLTGNVDPVGSFSTPFYALNAARCRPAAARATKSGRTITSATWASK